MPCSTPLICCSSGVATEASTSVALAPMKVVVTWIIGGTMSGYCAIGRPRMATRPSITMMIDSTMATMGRLTKKRAMIGLLVRGLRRGRRRRLRAYGHAVGDGLQAFGDDLIARLQPFLDHPQRVDTRSDGHRLEFHLVVRADDRDAAQVLQLLHGALRDEERTRLVVGEH